VPSFLRFWADHRMRHCLLPGGHVPARFNHYKVRCEAAVAPTAVRTLRKWLPSVVTFIRHDPVENSNSLPSTGYGLAAQRLPCKLQLLADPDRFRVEGPPLERGEAIKALHC
jgi:hypothetical protein